MYKAKLLILSAIYLGFVNAADFNVVVGNGNVVKGNNNTVEGN
jgi:hypothetical protein